MKITRSKLIEIVEQEVRAALLEKGSKKGKKPDQTTAADDQAQITPPGGGPDPIQSAPPIDGGMNDDEDQDLDSDSEEKAEKDQDDAVDADGTGGEKPSGAVNQGITGKTVQSITINPKSDVLKGAAKEVVITFNETTDPLRIIVTPTGMVEFFWGGQLHDIP